MSTLHALRSIRLSSGRLILKKRERSLQKTPGNLLLHLISFFQWVLMPYHEHIYYQLLCCPGSIQLPLKYLDPMGEIKVLGQKSQHYQERRGQEKDGGNQYFPLC